MLYNRDKLTRKAGEDWVRWSSETVGCKLTSYRTTTNLSFPRQNGKINIHKFKTAPPGGRVLLPVSILTCVYLWHPYICDDKKLVKYHAEWWPYHISHSLTKVPHSVTIGKVQTQKHQKWRNRTSDRDLHMCLRAQFQRYRTISGQVTA